MFMGMHLCMCVCKPEANTVGVPQLFSTDAARMVGQQTQGCLFSPRMTVPHFSYDAGPRAFTANTLLAEPST